MKSLSRLGAVIKKEVRQLLFGYAINTDVRNVRAVVADQARTHLSRQFVDELAETQVVRFIATASTSVEIEALLRRGEVSIGIVIPPDFDRRVADRSRAAVRRGA